MKPQQIVIAGQVVNYINETGDIMDEVQLQEAIELGDKEGTLYWSGFIIPIGKWWITDWKEVAKNLYTSYQKYQYSQTGGRVDTEEIEEIEENWEKYCESVTQNNQ